MRKTAKAVAILVCVFLFALQSNTALSEDLENGRPPASNDSPPKFRVFLLRFISARQGMQFLSDANIVNVTQLNDSTLELNADQETLVKASNLLKLVDSKEKYVVKALLPADDVNKLPRMEAIAAEISYSGAPVSIGNFFNLPGGTGFRAIMGIHNGKLVAVAPAAIMDKIVAIVEQNAGGLSAAKDSTVSVNTVYEPNTLYSDLLSSIAEAEKDLAKAEQEISFENTEPNLVQHETEDEKQRTADQDSYTLSDSNDIAGDLDTKADPCSPHVAGEEDTSQLNLYEPQLIPNADETLELELPEKLDIIQLLDLVGKYLNLNYVYDARQLQGRQINLKIQGPIKVGELYPLAESVLKFTNLVMTRKGNLVTIVPIENALDADPMLMDGKAGQVQAGDVVVTRIYQLNYIDTTQAKALLDAMKVGAVTELQGMGTLIITAYAYRMNRVEQLLEVIDKPGRPKQFKYRQLKYTMAKTLAPKVKQLIEQLGDISIAVAAPQPVQPTPTRRSRRPVRAQPTPAPSPETAKSAVYLDADERTNRILMIGSEQELAVVEDLIDSLDVAQQDLRMLRVYEIQHVDAQEVRKKLEELGVIGASRETTPTGRITSRAARASRARAAGQPGEAPPTPTPGGGDAEAELPTEEMQVVVLESTNSLMVNASPEQHVLVATIIAYVDSESIEQAIPYVVYPLQNQPPEHVAEVLQKLIQEVSYDQEGKIQTVKKTDEDIIIVPDPSTFSLIVYASKKNQDWVANLIKTLDKRRPQVLIDVTLVEVTNIEAFDLDLQIASKFPVMKADGEMDVVGAVTTPFLEKRSTEAFSSPGSGTAQAFYSDRHIQALLTALESKNYGRVLAKPKILVNDGQRGLIRTTDTTNVKIENTIIPDQGTAQTSTSYQPYSAGISLEIQPNIGEGDLLLLIVRLERTDFLTRSDISLPPDSRANTVETIVTVPNDKTIILGGLLKLNQSKGNTKIPLLGDIPIVGGLFRSTANTVNDSKLYVFVKANILRPESGIMGLPELERISERNRAAFEGAEDKFQKHEDWPGIKPKPVDPLRVLDAE
ncbi:MAG: hypothetical protein JW749_06490 [Sedimentisphaerales bacterium]|nr:hypothetical protein [Sedimentisphaerales bacterium]